MSSESVEGPRQIVQRADTEGLKVATMPNAQQGGGAIDAVRLLSLARLRKPRHLRLEPLLQLLALQLEAGDRLEQPHHGLRRHAVKRIDPPPLAASDANRVTSPPLAMETTKESPDAPREERH